jgi:Family of unknown function (DUF6644)
VTNVLSFCRWLADTALSTYIKESLWGFQIIVGIHIVALTLSVGTIIWFDLRLLGASLPGTAASKVYRQLIPIAAIGFVVMFTTGALLFVAYPVEAYHNVFFRTKIAVIALAGINALVYHLFSERKAEQIERETGVLPRGARIAGGLSLVLWTTVILCGRMISYTLYSH